MKRARVSLASTEIDQLNSLCNSIKDIAEKTKVSFNGPIPLPTKKLKLTTRKSPDGEGKASWERYEMRIHKRLIDLGVDERAFKTSYEGPNTKRSTYRNRFIRMKELTKKIKQNLEELLEMQSVSLFKDTMCGDYLASLSKKGYDVQEYKTRYFKILSEKNYIE